MYLTIENAAHLATIAGSFIGAASLIAIAVQQQRQTKLARAANSQSFVQMTSQFVLQVSASKELSNLYLVKSVPGAQFDSLDAERRLYLISWWMTFYENLIYQHRCVLLDKVVYDAWYNDMVGFLKRRAVTKDDWLLLRDNYNRDFKKVIDDLV